MGFTFDAKDTVNICGKDYPFDSADMDMVRAVTENFPRVMAVSSEFSALYDSMRAALRETPENASGIGARIPEKSRELLDECAGFIRGCLGEAEYDEIFQGRRENCVEHVKLCSYLFEHLAARRAKIVEQYLDPPEEAHAFDTSADENP